ncbi:uncharacterized protein VTP21DRAFT_10408 [Calcarisporiella thermophila]|uniref:uncharacterized protein n=1 Tax=Calcarisporiella thermophila TaxID=911321 RepID=UPI0037444752
MGRENESGDSSTNQTADPQSREVPDTTSAQVTADQHADEQVQAEENAAPTNPPVRPASILSESSDKVRKQFDSDSSDSDEADYSEFQVRIEDSPVMRMTTMLESEDYALIEIEGGEANVKCYTGGEPVEELLPAWGRELAAASSSSSSSSSSSTSSDDSSGHSEGEDEHDDSSSDSSHHGTRGLSSEEALQKLVEAAQALIDEERKHSSQNIHLLAYVMHPVSLLNLAIIFILLAYYIFGYLNSSPYQLRLTGALVESLLILLVFIWNGYLYQREMRLGSREITDRAQSIIKSLKISGVDAVQDIRIPIVSSVSSAKVIRDGLCRVLPTTLLVEGDTVELHYGDHAPCRMQFIPTVDIDEDEQDKPYILEAQQPFRTTLFGDPPPRWIMEEYVHSRGRFRFLVLETPIEKCLRAAITLTRPASVVQNSAKVMQDLVYGKLIWIALAIAVLVGLLRFLLNDYPKHHDPHQAFDLLALLPVLTILPLLPLSLPTLWMVARSAGNAVVLVLFDALEASKTAYEEDEDVDEFDNEAPPPTKNVELTLGAVLRKVWSLLTKWDHVSLTRSTNLFESLATVTVICCIDREGTISNPFPSVEQLLFLDGQEDITALDIVEDARQPPGIRFEDEDWNQHLPSLKPIGLNLLLNTSCGVTHGRRRTEHHKRQSGLHVHGRTKPARQACLCSIGRAIGFVDRALSSFKRRKEIYTFAPYHDSLQYRIPFYHYEIPSMLSSIFEEPGAHGYHLLSDGHLEIILDFCTDYWDGAGVKQLSATVEKKIYDFYQNAVVNDLQIVAYSYRPISSNKSRIPFLDRTEDGGFAFVVMPYAPPPTGDAIEDLTNVEPSPSDPKLVSNDSNGGTDETDASLAYTSQKLIPRTRPRHPPWWVEGDNENDVSSDSEMSQQDFYRNVIRNQVFLGLASLAHEPKTDVCDFIEDLRMAGIRFVYFSRTAERESKAYAERLGLETDWNSCILLSSANDEECGSGYLQEHDIKAKLPRGIENIRPHLEEVDDIPLHVSLFAECTPEATQEMIRVFQEYGEVVCCIGSALNAANTPSFAMADVSVAVEPARTRAVSKGRLRLDGIQPPLVLGAALVGLPCGLFMQYETSVFALSQIIREARRLLTNLRQAFIFLVGASFSLSAVYLVADCLLFPPLLTGYQMLWYMFVILPLLGCSFLFTPHEADIMSQMPNKNDEHLKDRWRFVTYWALRFVPAMAMSVVVYGLVLSEIGPPYRLSIFGDIGWTSWLHWGEQEQLAVLFSQNCALVVIVWYSVCLSGTFLNRTLPLWEFPPYRNRAWIVANVTCLCLQFVFCAVSLQGLPFSFAGLSWYIYVLAFLWPLVFLPVQHFVKMHDRKEWIRFQKRSKLIFNTKLGMHSPL